MTTRRLAAAAALFGAVALVGCAVSGNGLPLDYMTPGPNAYVGLSNQSTEQDRVVMALYVDGRPTSRRSVKSVFLHPVRAGVGNSHDVVPLVLAPGSHTIRVVAEGTTAGAETHVVVSDDPYTPYAFVRAEFGVDSGGRERVSSEVTVTIHVSTEQPAWCH